MIEEIKKVAIRGDIEAQFHLGVCYQNGMGVKRGHRKAEKWARKAVEEGYAKAQIVVGMSYYTGEGLPKDHVEAYAWINLVAAQGEEEAQDAVIKFVNNSLSPNLPGHNNGLGHYSP